MRIRHLEIDPVIVLMAIAAAAIGLLSGLGPWAIGAAVLIPVGAYGSRFLAASASRRFALPPAGTQERALVARALVAASVMRRLVQSMPPGPVMRRSSEMERQARMALPTIRALALQALRVRRLAEGIPVDGLEVERSRTSDLIAAGPADGVRIELESSLRSTEAQLRTGLRMRTLAEELIARTGALAGSMEAAAAGIAELQALSSSDPTSIPDVALASLSREIDTLRRGLEEAQTFGRRAAAIHLLEV